jgi:molecular chaperone DnaK
MARRHFVGIDLGTCFSSLAYCDEQGRLKTLRLPDGQIQIASAAYFRKDGTVVVGTEALEHAVVDASRVARAFKRQMGRTEYRRHDGTDFHDFVVDKKRYRPEELSGMVLRRLLDVASKELGPIESAVISVPHTFKEKQRRATQDAGHVAGLKSVELIEEPVAAAISYGQQLVEQGARGAFMDVEGDVGFDETILVFDLGGGTLDVTVLRLSKEAEFEVLAVGGDAFLGGENWDDVLMHMLIPPYRLKTHVEPLKNLELLQEMRLKVVEAKKTLSSSPKAQVEFAHNRQKFQLDVKVGDFQMESHLLLEKCERCLVEVLGNADMKWNSIDQVLIVGGASRMPMIRSMLKKVSRHPLSTSLSPDVAIANGAALHAARLAGVKLGPGVTNTVNPYSLGLLVHDPESDELVNDVVLKANEEAEKPVTRTYRFQPGLTRLDLAILLGGASNPKECEMLGKGSIAKLPGDLREGDKIDVTFTFRKNGMLFVESRLRRQGLAGSLELKFEVTVDGRMAEEDVEKARKVLDGVELV